MRNPRLSDDQHVLGGVAVLEAGEDHAVLRTIDIGRHARIIPGCRARVDVFPQERRSMAAIQAVYRRRAMSHGIHPIGRMPWPQAFVRL